MLEREGGFCRLAWKGSKNMAPPGGVSSFCGWLFSCRGRPKFGKQKGWQPTLRQTSFSPVYLLKPWKLNIHYEIVCILRPFMLTKVQKDAMPGV